MFQLKTLSGKLDKIVFPTFAFILAVFLILLIFHREVVIDEGVYLYAGKLVSEGKIPYLDFAHVQGPLFPVFYGLLNILFGQDIYVNRIITAVFGLSGLIFGGLIAKKLGGKNAESVYFLFCITSVYLLIHYMVVSTYAITSFLLYSAVFLAVCKNKTVLPYLMILIASAIRLSVLIIVPILAVYVMVENENKKKTFWLLLTITIIFYSIIFLPFILKSSELFFYNIFGVHFSVMETGERFKMVIDTLIANLKDYSVLMIGFLSSILGFLKIRNSNSDKIILLYTVFIALFLSHLLPVQSRGSYYNSLNMPIVFIIIGCIFTKIINTKLKMIIIVIILLNFVEQIVLVRKNRLVLSEKPIEKINSAAKYVKQNLKESDILLTFNTLLAVQSNRNIPIEFAEDCFSYKGD